MTAYVPTAGGGGLTALLPAAPTGAVAETMVTRPMCISPTAFASGTLVLTAIVLPGGLVTQAANFLSQSTALVGGNNQWCCICNASRVPLIFSSDLGAAAWAANTVQSFPWSAPFAVPSTGLYYIGLLVNATTPPNIFRANPGAGIGSLLAPSLGGTSSAGLTNIASCPSPVAVGAGGVIPYCYLT